MTTRSLAEVLEISTARCKTMDAPLADRLAAFAEEVSRVAPEFTVIVENMVRRLKSAGAGDSAPAVGDMMPTFVLPDEQGRLVSLAALLENATTVVAFHRGHWCPYCRINADSLASIHKEVAAAGGQMVVITPETARYNQRLKQEVNADFPFLTDLDCGYALELQLTIRIVDEKRVAMTAAGWDIAVFGGSTDWILPIPATFVVRRDGIISARYVDPDYRKRMDTDRLLAAVKAG